MVDSKLNRTIAACASTEDPFCRAGELLRVGGSYYAPMEVVGDEPLKKRVDTSLRLGSRNDSSWTRIGAIDSANMDILNIQGSVSSASGDVTVINGGVYLNVRVNAGVIEEKHSDFELNGRPLYLEITYVAKSKKKIAMN